MLSVPKEGSIELRITWNRIQKHVTTGVRVLPKQWRNGQIINRLDAFELQRALDMFVTKARQIINLHYFKIRRTHVNIIFTAAYDS